MTGTLVDSCVILDIFTEDPVWYPWSSTQLDSCAESGLLYINPVIYAEVSIRFQRIEELDDVLREGDFLSMDLSNEAAFLAGKAYLDYKKRNGNRSATLPDFFIGAQAAVLGLRLLTRDAWRFRTYFPRVTLISPK